jgi:hypothetical protein
MSARFAGGNHSMKSLADRLFTLWAELFCSDRSHHKRLSPTKNLAFFAPKLHSFSYRFLRKILLYKNFGLRHPIQNIKVPQQHDVNVVKLSNSFALIEL